MDNELYIELVEKILDNIDEGIHFIDEKSNTIIYNNAMANLEEMSKDDVIKKSFDSVSKKMKNSTLLDVLENRIPIENNIQTYHNSKGKEIITKRKG